MNVLRIVIAAAFTLAMALGMAMLLFYALAVSCVVAALLGRDQPYRFAIGAALLFAATLLVPTLIDGPPRVDPLGFVVLFLAQCVGIGLGAAGLVHALRLIVEKVKR